ncbi:hypothetical protein [Pseudoduganella lutea]|uniref:Uncharacterized protein n=1 Tax=Pseudoduganella lutea TaxID=321985 RepID=A0A4V0Z335_9BURK|nr:hypothetical protein [Pseudoduganella lutea]QBE62063.1 hypothetical protein EWM63_02915 [Pseudoduganella lutea]
MAEKAELHLRDIFQATGLRIAGTPQIVREDGTLIRIKPSMDAAYITTTFGRSGAPNVDGGSNRWLGAAVDASFDARPVDPSAGSQAQAKPAGNANNLLSLKKLLGQ